jgi:hypothetical protein
MHLQVLKHNIQRSITSQFNFKLLKRYTGVSKNVPVRLPGTRFETRNCNGEPCRQETYRDIFWKTCAMTFNVKCLGATSFSRSWIRSWYQLSPESSISSCSPPQNRLVSYFPMPQVKSSWLWWPQTRAPNQWNVTLVYAIRDELMLSRKWNEAEDRICDEMKYTCS